MSENTVIFCVECDFEDNLANFKFQSMRQFSEYDVQNGLPAFFLRTDEDIFAEVCQKRIDFSYKYGLGGLDHNAVFKEHGADPRDPSLVPKKFEGKAWEVWNRIRRMTEIKANTEVLMLWGLERTEAENIAKIEGIVNTHHGDKVIGKYSFGSDFAGITESEISKICEVDSKRASEIWEMFFPMRWEYGGETKDYSNENHFQLHDSYLSWRKEMERGALLKNIPNHEQILEIAPRWASELGLKKISGPQMSLFLFEEGFDLVGNSRKTIHKMINELLENK